MSLLNHARPIPEVLQDEKVPPRVRRLLSEIPAIKSYGERYGLKPTSNYRRYVALDRPAAVWVVSACEALRFNPRQWNFPIVGSVPYLGWFDLRDARDFAQKLRSEGWDVDLRGASAYSTLGWFPDPVLSSMIPAGDEALGDLVNVILHESVHATHYVKGQSYFDESVASFIADRLTYVYLDETRGEDSVERRAYAQAELEDARNRRLFHAAYEELARLYDSGASDERKLAEKKRVLDTLRKETQSRRELSNATLVQFKAYNEGTQGFEALFKACGGDWRRFVTAVRSVRTEDFSREQEEAIDPVLKIVAARVCGRS